MSIPAVYLPQAEDDLDAAYGWYESQKTGLGEQFLAAVSDRVADICLNPQSYGLFRGDVRAAMLSLPYVVYYRDRGTDVLVIAVQHGRRSTRAWRGRG